MPRPVFGPVLSRAVAQRREYLTYAQIRVAQAPRIVAAHDPLLSVPRGDFTLADFSYEGADLSQHDFGNCNLLSSGRA